MRTKTNFLLTVLFLLSAFAAHATSKQWLHLYVEDANKDETVKVNIPLSLVEAMVPLVEQKGIKDGKIKLNQKEVNVKDLRNVWRELREQGDNEYVSIEKPDMRLRIYTEGDFLYVKPEETSKSQVDIKMPLSVVDAMLSGDGDELNLMAAIRALQDSGVREIVTVRDRDKTLMVWIDESNRGK
jgi:hypothetical protein